MTGILDHFTQELVSINCGPVVRRINAYRYREFAVHPDVAEPEAWRITHCPTGLALGRAGVFDVRDDALAATIEVDRLRNGWLFLDGPTVAAIAPSIVTILERFRGRPARVLPPVSDDFRPRFNGYAEGGQ